LASAASSISAMFSQRFFLGKVRTLSVSALSPAAALGYPAGRVPSAGRHWLD